MRPRTIYSQIRALEELIDRTRVATAESPELQSHWAKYLCVVTSGIIENALSDLYADLASRTSSPAVAQYVSTTLSRLQNPNSDDILQLAGKFKAEWRKDLDTFMASDGGAEAVNSIMAQRHLIAHGRGAQSNISISELSKYVKKAIKIIEFIESQCA